MFANPAPNHTSASARDTDSEKKQELTSSVPETQAHRILRLGDVIKLTGYKRASLYAKASRHSPQFDPTFPRRVSLSSTGRGAVGWIESEIFDWLQSRADARSASSTTLKN